MIEKGTKPHFTLRALHKKSGIKATVGVGWQQSDGSISIALNNWINLYQDGDLVLTLFPKDNEQKD